IVVAPSPRVQTVEARTPRQVPVLCQPFRDPLACRMPLLTRRAPRDARHTLSLWGPGTRAAQTGDAPDRKSTRLNSSPNAHLVCRLLLEKKNKLNTQQNY